MAATWHQALIAVIFFIGSVQMLLPSNAILPLDRRMTCVLGAFLCFLVISIKDNGKLPDIGHYIDVDVLAILTAIMALNFVILQQPPVKRSLLIMKTALSVETSSTGVSSVSSKGIWLVSIIVFAASALLTNDGIVLLIVWPIMDALVPTEPQKHLDRSTRVGIDTFSHVDLSVSEEMLDAAELHGEIGKRMRIERLFMLLCVACSANIGSALTLTGNPQNMLIASCLQREGSRLSGGVFFLMMLLPALLAFVLTIWTLNSQRCRALLRMVALRAPKIESRVISMDEHEECDERTLDNGRNEDMHSHITPLILESHSARSCDCDQRGDYGCDQIQLYDQPSPLFSANRDEFSEVKHVFVETSSNSSIVRTRSVEGALISSAETPSTVSAATTTVSAASSPMIVFSILALMILIEFTGTILWDVPLSVLFPCGAVVLVVSVVLSNFYWSRLQTLSTSSRENKITVDDVSKFYDELCSSLDYNLLVIFTGLFIVSGFFVDTGIPSWFWDLALGSASLEEGAGAWTLLCFGVVITLASQLLGNVPVVYMAASLLQNKDKNHDYGASPSAKQDSSSRELAWLLLAWISTIAGNLTLVGSAANVIVAEKAARYTKAGDSVKITAIEHFKACGLVTVVAIGTGSIILWLEILLFQ